MNTLDRNFFALDGGIIQEFLPGNIINANLQGYTTFLNKNTPANFAAYSLQQYAQQTVPDVIQVTPNPSQDQKEEASKVDSDFQKRLNALLGLLGSGVIQATTGIGTDKTIATTTETANDLTTAKSDLCKDYNNDGLIPYLSICNFATESGKRIGLVVVGILLIALGIWSLR